MDSKQINKEVNSEQVISDKSDDKQRQWSEQGQWQLHKN